MFQGCRLLVLHMYYSEFEDTLGSDAYEAPRGLVWAPMVFTALVLHALLLKEMLTGARVADASLLSR